MELVNVINSVGFPIFVSLFFLLKLDKSLNKIAEKLAELNQTIIEYKDMK
ncbi:YvrJ family protein [Gemella sp. 19428wG2_WT2a]|nr:YvrJ family protein [Gemella sp. 19428wG2_WT2a]TFU58186.1 YvrJ family protein [Gemella sp. WT2a]